MNFFYCQGNKLTHSSLTSLSMSSCEAMHRLVRGWLDGTIFKLLSG